MKIVNNPKISLGMPVLNGEKHIHYALDRIFKQTFKNFKIHKTLNGKLIFSSSYNGYLKKVS
jgi:cephalosporin hydroxylase